MPYILGIDPMKGVASSQQDMVTKVQRSPDIGDCGHYGRCGKNAIGVPCRECEMGVWTGRDPTIPSGFAQKRGAVA